MRSDKRVGVGVGVKEGKWERAEDEVWVGGGRGKGWREGGRKELKEITVNISTLKMSILFQLTNIIHS